MSAYRNALDKANTEIEVARKFYNNEIEKIKTEAEKTIARNKIRIKEMDVRLVDWQARAKAEAEERTRAYADEITRIQIEAAEMLVKVKTEATEQINSMRCKLEARTEEMIAKIKAQTAEQTARVKAEAEAKEDFYNNEIARLKAQSGEKLKSYSNALSKAIAELKTKTSLYNNEIAGIKAKSEKKIAKVESASKEKLKSYSDAVAKARKKAQEKSRAYAEMIAKAREEAEVRAVEMAQKPAPNNAGGLLTICAKDIMQKDVVWGSSDMSVQQALAKMRQHNGNYIMIGQNGVLEGVLSKDDLTGTISPYLRPEFAKWRRPLDEATLQIKVKWITSAPSCFIHPTTSLVDIINRMQRFGENALVVLDQQDKVQGLVTVFDVFKAIPKTDPNCFSLDESLMERMLGSSHQSSEFCTIAESDRSDSVCLR